MFKNFIWKQKVYLFSVIFSVLILSLSSCAVPGVNSRNSTALKLQAVFEETLSVKDWLMQEDMKSVVSSELKDLILYHMCPEQLYDYIFTDDLKSVIFGDQDVEGVVQTYYLNNNQRYQTLINSFKRNHNDVFDAVQFKSDCENGVFENVFFDCELYSYKVFTSIRGDVELYLNYKSVSSDAEMYVVVAWKDKEIINISNHMYFNS